MPPGAASRSATSTRRTPRRRSSAAADSPAGPAPTIRTSASTVRLGLVRRVRLGRAAGVTRRTGLRISARLPRWAGHPRLRRPALLRPRLRLPGIPRPRFRRPRFRLSQPRPSPPRLRELRGPEQGGHRRAAVERLAAPVHRAGPAPQPVESRGWYVAGQRVAQLAAGDPLAVAGDVTVGGVGRDPLRLLV